MSWFTPLYLLAIYGLVRFFARVKKAEAGSEKVAWTPLESVGVTLCIYFGAQLVAGLLISIIPLFAGWDEPQTLEWLTSNVYGQFGLIVIVEAVTVWLLWSFLKRRGAGWRTIGLKRRPRPSDLGYALLGFAVYFAAFILVIGLFKNWVPSLDLNQEQQIGFDSPSSWQLPLVFMSLVLLPAVVEELVIRGFLYTGLRDKLPKIWAMLVASGLFGIAHLQAGSGEPLLWIAGIDTFVLSLVLIQLRERTGSLWAPISLHMLKNGIAFVTLFIFHIA